MSFIKRNSCIIFLIITILATFFTILYTMRYDIFDAHDWAYPFGRNFLEPEHGRLFATYTNYVLSEVLPEYLNIHPSDFQTIFINPLKAFFSVTIFIFFAFAVFLFSEKKNKICNPAFILTFILVFLTLFNDEIDTWEVRYFLFQENTVFWEYPMSLILYAPFWLIYTYFYVKNTPPPGKHNYPCLLGFSYGDKR